MGVNEISENNNNPATEKEEIKILRELLALHQQERHQSRTLFEQQQEQNRETLTLIKQQQSINAATLEKLNHVEVARKQSNILPLSKEPPKVDRWTMPFLVGACSGLVWIMQNGFVPFYNSFGSIWLGMFYGPALIGYLIYVLGCAMEQKRFHSEHPEAGGLHTPEIEKINSECLWLGLKVALSLLGAQIASRIMFANGLAQVIENSMGGWSGRMLDAMPMEFHIGMMFASAIGFALCFAGLSYYQKGKLSMKDLGVALGVGLFAGGGIYIAHLLPGMNTMFNWNIPEGISLMIGAAANGAVLTAALAIKPSLVDVSGVSAAPEPTNETLLLSQTQEKTDPPAASAFSRMYKAGAEQIGKIKEGMSAIKFPSLNYG